MMSPDAALEATQFEERSDGVDRAFGALAALSLLSKLSGFVRLAVFAAVYGGGRNADLFLAAMLLPDLLYKFITEGIVSAAAVPLFVKNRDNSEIRSRVLWSLFWPLSFIGLIITLILIFFSGVICELITPGFDAALTGRMASLWRILAPYTLFSLQGALLTAFLNANGMFAMPALGPIFVNLTTIIGTVFVGGGPVEYIGWAVSGGSLLQFIWLLALTIRTGANYPWHYCSISKIDFSAFVKFAYAAAPTAAWVLLGGIIPVFERALMSSLDEGALAALNYTDKLVNLPLGIVAVSLATAAFPALTAAGEDERAELFDHTLWLAGILMTPMILTMASSAGKITSAVYGRGKFDTEAIGMTAKLLENYALALLPAAFNMLLNRLCFACGEYKIPFVIGSAAIMFQIVLDIYLLNEFGAAGVAWGAVGAAFFQTLCLLFASLKIVHSLKIFYKAFFAIIFWTAAVFIGSNLTGRLAEFINDFAPQNQAGYVLAALSLWVVLQIIAAMTMPLKTTLISTCKQKTLQNTNGSKL